MLEKYVEGYNEAMGFAIIAKLQEERKLSRSAAIQLLYKEIPKESYFQEKIMDAIKKKYPDAFIRKISQGAYSEGGFPDLLVINNGQVFAFEVKRPVVGITSKLQLLTLAKLKAAGAEALIVRWPEEALAIMANYDFRENEK